MRLNDDQASSAPAVPLPLCLSHRECILASQSRRLEVGLLLSNPIDSPQKEESPAEEKWYDRLSTRDLLGLPVADQGSSSVSQMQEGTLDPKRIQTYCVLQHVL
jgi:hypothetical protein